MLLLHYHRLEKLNAIVFLWLKPKGKRNKYTQISRESYKKLIDRAFELEVPIGFDSCSAPMFMQEVPEEKRKMAELMAESCESTLFSYYINVDGMGYPCSFMEDMCEGMDMIKAEDFMKDAWLQVETANFRDKCIMSKDENGCRNCIAFNLRW